MVDKVLNLAQCFSSFGLIPSIPIDFVGSNEDESRIDIIFRDSNVNQSGLQ